MYNDIEWGHKKEKEKPVLRRLFFRPCSKIHASDKVVSRVWIREVVRNSPIQTKWRMGRCRWYYDAQFQWKWTSRFSRIQCFWKRRFEEQRKREIVCTFQWQRRNRRSDSSFTFISINQLSVYGAVADMCGEWPGKSPEIQRVRETRSAWEPGNHGNATRSVDNKSNFSDWCRSTRETCCVNTSRISQIFQSTFNWPNSAPMLVSRRLLKKDSTSRHFDDEELDRLKGSCRQYTLPRSDQSSQVKGWIRGNTKVGPVLDVMPSVIIKDVTGVEIMIESLIWRPMDSFLGSGSWTDQQIRNWRRRKRLTLKRLEREQYRETCCEG